MKHQESSSCSGFPGVRAARLPCPQRGTFGALDIPSAPGLCPGLSVTAGSPLGWGEREHWEQGRDKAPQEQAMSGNPRAGSS